jgi:hypothetical protein
MRKLDRDTLLRETHRLNHELGYIGFRDEYFNDPDVVGEWPDPAARERGLRGFWDQQQAGNYASYRQDFARYSVNVLAAWCDYLRELLAGDRDGQVAYYRRASETGRCYRLRENGGGDIEAPKDRLPSPGELADEPPAKAGGREAGMGSHAVGQERVRGRGR